MSKNKDKTWTPSRRIIPVLERFWSKVEKTDTCWIWRGGKFTSGYGSLYFENQRSIRAHRYSYELVKGKIPNDLVLDHLCRNRACVNPDHLEAVTMKENILRGIHPTAANAVKTHCIHGHPFDEENTYWRKDRPGRRQCKECTRKLSNVSYHRRMQRDKLANLNSEGEDND